MAHVTKQAALSFGNTLDAAADIVLKQASALGIDPTIAKKFAYQCDLLSDYVAKQAGFDIAKMAAERKQALSGDPSTVPAGSESPEQIGQEQSGPHEGDGDESYMKGEFTQQENRELREKVEGGEMGPDKTSPGQQSARPGVQASLVAGQKLASLYTGLASASTRCASSDIAAVKNLGERLAASSHSVLQFQARLMEGSESMDRVAQVEAAAGHLLPHIAGEVAAAHADKLARMADIVSGVANPS